MNDTPNTPIDFAKERDETGRKLLAHLESISEKYGKPIGDVAMDHGIDPETVRAQIAEKPDKTGLDIARIQDHRETEMILLKNRAAAAREGDEGRPR